MTTWNAEQLEAEIKRTIRRVPVSSGGNLVGFKMDLEPYLEKSGMFRNVHVQQTHDPLCVLVATCEGRNAALSADTIASVLRAVWLHDLRYAHWEAHYIAIEDTSITLRFITTSGNAADHLCVTGRIIVSRPATETHTDSPSSG